MMQRNKPSPTAVALATRQSAALRIALAALTTVALVTVLVLITGATSAEYGFA